jgi:hypothetical protein
MAASVKAVPRVVIFACLGLGLVSLGVGALLGRSAWNRQRESQRAEGTVVELVRIEPSGNTGTTGQRLDEKPSYAPVVQYQVGGNIYRIRSKVSSETPSYSVGESVSVLYPPDNPSDGRIDSFAENWLLTLLFAGGGLLFLVFALALFLARLRSARTASGATEG